MKCDYTVEGGKAVIHIFYRKADGSRGHFIDRDFLPYFWVPASALADQLVSKYVSGGSPNIARGLVIGDPEGVPIAKTFSNLPTDVPHDRSHYSQTWEAKEFFNKRYLVDKVIENMDKTFPIIQALDIECVPFQGKYHTVAIGFYNTNERIYHEIYHPYKNKLPNMPVEGLMTLQKGVEVPYELTIVDSRDELIETWIDETCRLEPDDFVGWNVHFDLTTLYDESRVTKGTFIEKISPLEAVYLRKGFRGRKQLYIGGCSVFDLYRAALTLLPSQEAYSLRYIASKFLDFEKKDYRHRIQWLREHDPDELIRYNLGDVYCCIALMEQKQLFDAFYERSLEAACNIEDTDPIWKWLEILLLRRSRLKLPTKLSSGERECKGPRLLDPVPGVHKNVVAIDFEGLYPAIARTWNMGPSTMHPDGDLKVGNGIAFFSKPKSVWVDLIEYLLERKQYYDDKLKALNLSEEEKLIHPIYHRRNGYKIATVAATGLLNWSGFRIFVPEILDSIFYIAREIVDWVVDRIRQWGYTPIYGHTDSVFVRLNSLDEADSFCEKVNEEVDAFCEARDVKPGHFSIGIDYRGVSVFCDTGHNRWAMITDKDELLVRGFEGRRVNVSDFSRRIQPELIKTILETQSRKKCRAFICRTVKEIKSGSCGMDALAYYHTLRKSSLAEYKRKTTQIRGIEFSNLFRGSYNFPRLHPFETLKYIPVRINFATQKFKERCAEAQVDLKKTKVIAYNLDENFEEFLAYVNSLGKVSVSVNQDKILDLNLIKRVTHVLEALGWDFSDLWTGQPKLEGFT